MRFVHITDSHVGPTPAFSHYGHAALPNLERIIALINALPFPIDFVLHTGDVVEDRSEAAYQIARSALAKLRLPIYYVTGNHDDPGALQRVLLGKAQASDRFDYQFTHDGIHFAIFDTRGPVDPAGTLTADQLAALRALCAPEGLPLVIALHHPPLPLDSRWLDAGWDGINMLLDCGEAFMDSILPARDRIKGVFFGHVHRGYQVLRNGVLFSSAPSSFGILQTWPDLPEPRPSPDELPGFNLVTITADQTVVRQHSVARP